MIVFIIEKNAKKEHNFSKKTEKLFKMV